MAAKKLKTGAEPDDRYMSVCGPGVRLPDKLRPLARAFSAEDEAGFARFASIRRLISPF